MGQTEILDLLSSDPDRRWTSTEIARELKQGESSIRHCLKRLRQAGLIVYLYDDLERRIYYYNKTEP